MNKTILIVLLAAVVLSVPGAVVFAQPKETAATKIITAQYGFEKDQDIEGWKAQNGNLSFSDAHYKDGQRSLEWSWQTGAMLEIAGLKGLKEAGAVYPGGIPEVYEPSFYPKDRYGGMKIWLYQEKPSSGQIVFQVGSSVAAARMNPKYRFAVNLDFTGWRTVWVCFEEDARVKDYSGSDDMQAMVAFPQHMKKNKGRLFIDHLLLLSFVSNKRNSDLQFVNNKRNLRSADGYEILKPFRVYTNAVYNQQVNKQLLEKESDRIAARLEFLILGDRTDDWKRRGTGIEKELEGKIKGALSVYEQLQLKSTNGTVNGAPLFAIRDEHSAPEGRVFDNVAQDVLFPLAADYRLNGSAASKEKLIQVLDYFLDQGWASGSALGTVDHVIRLTPIATAVFLLRNELHALNKLKPEVDMLAWHTRLGSMLHIDHTRGENSDKVRGGALVKLIAILLMENDARKQEMLQCFKDYMDYVASVAPGYSDTFKPDFSIYHHRGTYLNVYGTNAVNTMALIHWLLSGTSYAMSAQSTANIKQALQRQAAIAFGVQIHYGAGGRFPLNNSAIDGDCLPAFAYMSMTKDTIADRNLAALFNYIYGIAPPAAINKMLLPALTYSGTFGTLDLMVRAHEQSKTNIQGPADGVVVLPYSGLMAYRYKKAFATVKGYNKYVWDYEAGKGENNLGRYLSHGMLIMAQGDERNGFDSLGMDMNDGFDWSMLPGATTKMLPADKMLYFPKADNKYIEGKHRNFSESVIASGLQQGGNGLFALDLRDDVFPDEDRSLFDSSFRAKKSYFFIGNEIICLGSGISNKDSRYNTVTTLFQYHVNEHRMNYFNGKVVDDPTNPEQKADGGYFTDQNGLQYIIPKGQHIVLQQAMQNSYRSVKGTYQPVSARYIKACIDHGCHPKDQGYEYEVVMNTDAAALHPYLEKKSYTVLEKNNDVHIIQHKASGITAYAIYKAHTSLKGVLLTTSAPLLAMAKEAADGMLLTIANPDIGQARWNHNMSHMPDSITNAWAKGSVVTITLKGAWYAANYTGKLMSAVIRNGNTVLSLFCRDGESIDLPLQHREESTEGED
ncbi:lyase [Niabella ginsenosidivorans]|uniref:Lyase n=1 Tax=Niabella ginsenosidivorans TaxID=1176587 RepID=A0A1A9I1R4_9BACT|nr:chondroitinase family polysaccharide lyase [Niabella ginsenosidivorans]ANH80504.1 lyase [Niabella ginsenosidivorans]